MGSFEGVPAKRSKSAWQQLREASWSERGNLIFAWMGTVVPGVMLAVLLTLAAEGLSHWLGVSVLGFEDSPVSAIMLAIGIGLVIRNTIGLPAVYDAGLRLCLRRVLRIGVALLGLRLSLIAAGRIGLVSLPIVLVCITAALLVVTRCNRALGLSRRIGSLIAVGTSICGVSAIVATGPVINAEDDEVSYSVATITLFGMVALFAYPFLGHWLFDGDPQQVGLFLGTAIHDTAQVAGAGLMYQQQFGSPEAMDAAMVTKLVRNLSMVGVIPLMAVLYHGRQRAAAGAMPRWFEMVPGFVLAFVAMIALRSAGDIGERPFGIFTREAWEGLVASALTAAQWCLMLAMAAVGLGTSFGKLKSLGWKPFTVGLVAAALVGCVSGVMVKLMT